MFCELHSDRPLNCKAVFSHPRWGELTMVVGRNGIFYLLCENICDTTMIVRRIYSHFLAAVYVRRL